MMVGWKITFLLGWLIFRGYVKLPGSMILWFVLLLQFVHFFSGMTSPSKMRQVFFLGKLGELSSNSPEIIDHLWFLSPHPSSSASFQLGWLLEAMLLHGKMVHPCYEQQPVLRALLWPNQDFIVHVTCMCFQSPNHLRTFQCLWRICRVPWHCEIAKTRFKPGHHSWIHTQSLSVRLSKMIGLEDHPASFLVFRPIFSGFCC